MFYFFYGPDRDKARAKAHGVLDAMKKKRPAAESFRLTSENWSPARFDEYIGGQGLFERKFIVFCDGLFERPEAKDLILSRLEGIAKSENGFVFFEPKLDTASMRKLGAHAVKVEKFGLEPREGGSGKAKGQTNDRFNVFSLADALGQRDRKNLWALFRQALIFEILPEEINGVFFWQIKSILLAKDSKSASLCGLSPFVFSKSKKYAGNFTNEELKKISGTLVSIYHEARRGIHDFENALERFILTMV